MYRATIHIVMELLFRSLPYYVANKYLQPVSMCVHAHVLLCKC